MSAPLQRFVNAFTVGLTMRMIYFPQHPSVQSAAQNAASALAELMEDGGAGTVTVGQARGRLVCDGRAQLALTPVARRLIEFVKVLDAGAFRFSRETSVDELLALFSLYAETHAKIARTEAQALLRAKGIAHVELLPPLERTGSGGDAGIGAGMDGSAGVSTGAEGGESGADRGGAACPAIQLDEIPEAHLQAYHSLMAVVDTNHVQAARGGAIDVDGARARAEQMVAKDLQHLHDLMRLAHYPDFDAYTVGHSVRVSLLVTLVTERLGVPKEKMVEIAAAALLHDVGKSQIPQEILFKPGPLNADERHVMEGHPRLGGELLLASGEANPWSVCAAFGHHVRHDRRGYPKLPPYVKPTSATAVIHVCDVFEALTAVRPYKPAYSPWRAFEIMLQDHGGFDPAALRAFVRAIGVFPPGSGVTLSDGSEGVVTRAGNYSDRADRPDRPVVQIRKRADGISVDLESLETCDLSDPSHGDLRVVRLHPPVSDDAEDDEHREHGEHGADERAGAAAVAPPAAPVATLSIDPCRPV